MTRQLNLPALCLMIGTCLIAIGLLLYARHASADDAWQLPRASCYPIVSELTGTLIEAKPVMREGTDAIVWWCHTATGIEEDYRVGELGGPCEKAFRKAVTSLDIAALWSIDSVCFTRPALADELALVTRAEQLYEPRCAYAGTAHATQVLSKAMDGAIGPVRMDGAGRVIRWATAPDRPSCYQWIVAGSKRWCSVTGLTDTMGREIGPDSYVACRIERAPAEGWKP